MPNWRKGVQGPQRKYVKRKRRKAPVSKIVKKNTSDIRKLKSVGFQYCPFYLKTDETVTSAIHTHLLTAPNNWTKCFRTYNIPDADMPRQYLLKSCDVTWAAQCEASDVGNLWLQVMVVSLKPKMASQVITRTTRLSNMTENLDYINMDAGTAFALQGSLGYKLNPALYTVHYNSGQRRIGEATMGTSPTLVTNINNGTTRGKCRIKFKQTFKNDETGTNGFKDLNYAAIEPKQHLYLIYFSNTSGSVVTGGELFTTHRVDFHGNCNLPE